MCDGNSLPFADPLQERQEPALKRQIQHAARYPPGRRRRIRPMASFLLSGPDPGPDPEIRAPQAAAAHEGKAPLERVYGI